MMQAVKTHLNLGQKFTLMQAVAIQALRVWVGLSLDDPVRGQPIRCKFGESPEDPTGRQMEITGSHGLCLKRQRYHVTGPEERLREIRKPLYCRAHSQDSPIGRTVRQVVLMG